MACMEKTKTAIQKQYNVLAHQSNAEVYELFDALILIQKYAL